MCCTESAAHNSSDTACPQPCHHPSDLASLQCSQYGAGEVKLECDQAQLCPLSACVNTRPYTSTRCGPVVSCECMRQYTILHLNTRCPGQQSSAIQGTASPQSYSGPGRHWLDWTQTQASCQRCKPQNLMPRPSRPSLAARLHVGVAPGALGACGVLRRSSCLTVPCGLQHLNSEFSTDE